MQSTISSPAAAVLVDTSAILTEIGEGVGSTLDAMTIDIQNKLGSPITSVSADIATMLNTVDRKTTFNEPVVVHTGLLGSGVVVTQVPTPGTSSGGGYEIIAWRQVDLGAAKNIDQIIAELNWDLTGAVVGGGGSGTCKWSLQAVAPVLNAVPVGTDVTTDVVVNVGANSYAYGPGPLSSTALSALGLIGTFYLCLSALVTTATDTITGTIDDSSELIVTVHA